MTSRMKYILIDSSYHQQPIPKDQGMSPSDESFQGNKQRESTELRRVLQKGKEEGRNF